METTDPLYSEYIKTSKRKGNFDDQVYLRRIRNEHNDRVKMTLLPSKLFPTYFKIKDKGAPIPSDWDEKYLLHFNYIISNMKTTFMKNHKSWYI